MADAHLHDMLSTNAFRQAMGSDRPMVCVDLGYSGRNAALDTRFRQLCRVVAAPYDEGNLPPVESTGLEATVAGGAD